MASRVWTESSCTNARILEAHVIGYEVVKKRWTRNDYQFVIDVSWSYGNRTTTRRTYDDFYDLQCSILEKFPDEARPATRVIPWLTGRKVLAGNSKKLADQRLPDLDDYVKRLIQLPSRISECDVVLTFFEPDHDDHTDESTILPTGNRESFEDASCEYEQNDLLTSKKRQSQPKKGPRRNSSRKDGFVNHVNDDDDDNVDGDFEEIDLEIQQPQGLDEKRDEKMVKKRPSKEKKSTKWSKKEGLFNYQDVEYSDDDCFEGNVAGEQSEQVPVNADKIDKKRAEKLKKGSKKSNKKNGSILESDDDDDDDFGVYENLSPKNAPTKWEMNV